MLNILTESSSDRGEGMIAFGKDDSLREGWMDEFL
jgi:hypothetical protein